MPAERSRGSRRTGADGNQLVWTEPALAPGIAFATNLTPGAFEESKEPSNSSFTTFDSTPSAPGAETKLEPATPSLVPAPTFFFVDAPLADESKPKRASHKRKATPPPSPSSTSFPPSSGASSDSDASPAGPAPAPAAHIPRPPNAFILFRSSFIRAGAVPAHVEPSHASLSAIAGLTWAALPKPEKEAWHRRAKEERERHRERFPNYAFRPRHRTTSASTPNSNSTSEDGDCEDSGGGTPQRRRQQREVAPADRARQAHIARLLLTGLSGAALDEAIATFDRERKERGEGGVEVRFGVVETPEGRVAAEETSEKGKRECSPCVKRGTSKAEKRRLSPKQDESGKRRRTTSSPTSPSLSPASASPVKSSPSLPATPVDTPHAPFDFDLDALSSIPSTPVNDDFSCAATFEWPYASSPSSPASPTACYSPFDTPSYSYPPSPALSHSSSATPSASSSSWSSLEDLSMSLSLAIPSHGSHGPSPLSACSSMSSLGGDLSSLVSPASVSTTADCGTAAALNDLSAMYGALLPPYDLDLGLGGLGFGDDMGMGMGMGMDAGMGMGYLTGYLEAPTQADGIAAW